jgi:hypothetical protein
MHVFEVFILTQVGSSGLLENAVSNNSNLRACGAFAPALVYFRLEQLT